ncbi:hypothetical protein MBUL_03901 [Methylobacterium bullatum]|uniref:HTH cro/C1-type domain-containing protein n=1 Tax=Methylobacterium bullatum TaxID=570505 RepID=A0A679JLI6_9HYPH|nr:hypothetical protein MBUL_03901 [Methylobacterium bullatum]
MVDVARFAKIAADRLSQFEDGEREPSRLQMQKLADIYGVPLYRLASDAIPNLPALPSDFRKADPTPAALSPPGVKTLLASERISQFTGQIAAELGYTPVELAPRVQLANSFKARAVELRWVFDQWLAQRQEAFGFAGAPEQRFLGALRLFFEVQGGVVNVNDAPATDYMGFYVNPAAGLPTIFVNRTVSSKKAQLFTFAHEYAHALIGADGVSNPFRARNKIERSCNVFAAEFLAPMDAFAATVENFSKQLRTDTTSFIAAASAQSLLSKHAAAIRLVEAGYITQKDFRDWRLMFTAKPSAEKDKEKETAPAAGGGAPHAKRIGELGYLPVVLAKRAIDEKIIDAIDVVDGIGLSTTLQERAFSLATRRFEVALP